MIWLNKFNYSKPVANYNLYFVSVRIIGADPTGWPRMIRAVIE